VTIAWNPELNEIEVEVSQGVYLKKYDEIEVMV
jgi:hypothetical protein